VLLLEEQLRFKKLMGSQTYKELYHHWSKKTRKKQQSANETRHDKTNIMGLRPVWIQNSPGIRAA
jgi:hypothetical protein